jgi:nitrate/nitrite-specific signal transduction histidine kinase
VPNVNKLFRRLSIRAKLVIAFCLLGVVPVALVGGYGAVYSFYLLKQSIEDRLTNGVSMKADQLQLFLRNVKADVLFLSRLPTLQALVNLPSDAPARRKSLVSQLANDFLTFSQSHPSYYQVRYIDDRGQETVRAENSGNRHYIVPPDRLQNKSDRYYFREAMESPTGTIYVSPMDLNIEWGAVEFPHKPVIRYAVSLRNAQGEPRGIVIINLYASRILRQVMALGQEIGDVSLASSAGFYLSRSEWIRASRNRSTVGNPPFPSWLASYSKRLHPSGNSTALTQEIVRKEFTPALAATILSGRAGTVVESGLRGRIVAFAPIFPHRGSQGEFWVLVHAYRKADVLASSRSLQLLVLVLGGAILVVALFTGVAAARHFTRPILELIRGTEIVAGGDFDHTIKVETNDEIEELAQRFNVMTQKLREHEDRLQRAHERLEMKAREAEALYRIGTEISAFLDLDKILDMVADKARELLGSDAASLCLLDERDHEFVVGATSGPSHAFLLGTGQKIPDGLERVEPCHSLQAQGDRNNCPVACSVIRDEYLKARLVVPLKARDKTIGALCVGNQTPRDFIQKDIELLSGLASQAAIAIENAKLHGRVRSLAALEERERIGKDLHDGIIQSIYAAGLVLEDGIHLVDQDPAKARQRLGKAIDDLNTVIKDVRNYIFNLQPEVLHGKDIGQALADLVKELKINTLVDAELVVGDEINGLPSPEQKMHFFHIAREALANVEKHSEASRVRVELARVSGDITLSVEDNGIGLDPEKARAGGQGLKNMADRAKLLGGNLKIESSIGRGAQVVVTMPVEQTEPENR